MFSRRVVGSEGSKVEVLKMERDTVGKRYVQGFGREELSRKEKWGGWQVHGVSVGLLTEVLNSRPFKQVPSGTLTTVHRLLVQTRSDTLQNQICEARSHSDLTNRPGGNTEIHRRRT